MINTDMCTDQLPFVSLGQTMLTAELSYNRRLKGPLSFVTK